MRKVIGFLVLLSVLCAAQNKSTPRGHVIGLVFDSSGAVVPGAKVTITGPSGEKMETTNQDGQFLFPLLATGFYSLRVEKPGYVTVETRENQVAENDLTSVRVGLLPGDSRNTTSGPSNGFLIPELDYRLTWQFYDSVPLKNRIDVIIFRPGVSDPNAPKTSSDKRFIIKDVEKLPVGRSIGDIVSIY